MQIYNKSQNKNLPTSANPLRVDYPLTDDVIQQTFLGASIMDFSVNLGLNGSLSNLSIRLVEDDLNYGTSLRKNKVRDAVTEGYHPWNRYAWPEELTLDSELSVPWQGDILKGLYPNYGVLPQGSDLTGSKLDTETAKGDIFYPPQVGSPVFFQYFMSEDLTEECVEIESRNSEELVLADTFGDCIDPNGTVVYLEQKDTLGDPITDEQNCDAHNGIWNASTSKCEVKATKSDCTSPNNWVEYSLADEGCIPSFEFNGIFKKFERSQGSSGSTYTVEVIDPRLILENMTVLLKDMSSKTAPADMHKIEGSNRSLEKGFNGMSNVLNVFGYYEAVGFGNSHVNENGMIWYDPLEKTENLKTEYGENGWGILGALDTMLNSHKWREGGTDLISDYVENGEPFGGPPYYGVDHRTNQLRFAPLGERTLTFLRSYKGGRPAVGSYRYKVDLFELANLSEDYNPGTAGYCKERSSGNTVDREQYVCVQDALNYEWVPPASGGVLPHDFRINADKMTLLSLIEQVCEAAGVDFYVSLEKPKRYFHPNTEFLAKEQDYAGVIKVVPIYRKKAIVEPAFSLSKKSENKNYLSLAIDMATDKEEPNGPFTKPLDGHPNKRQSVLSSAELGYEYANPITGSILYGGKRTRIAGVTPQGDRLKGFTSIKWSLAGTFGSSSFAGVDQHYEYLPNIELDGVMLSNQTTIVDTFDELDGDLVQNNTANSNAPDGYTWNDYGYEFSNSGYCSDPSFSNKTACTGAGETWTDAGHKLDIELYNDYDYKQTGPQYSNDNFFPFFLPDDFRNTSSNFFDPEQLNRVNSKTIGTLIATAGSCTSPSFTDEANCVLHGNCEHDGTVTPDIPDYECAGYEGTWTRYIWTGIDQDKRSGYLDIYPCWGFEEDVDSSQLNGYSTAFDDVIDSKVRKRPIKGMFWDDDPYRDFHPTDGIFSVFEFYNPGLGICIDENCSFPQGSTFVKQCLNRDGTLNEGYNPSDPNPVCEDDNKGDCYDPDGNVVVLAGNQAANKKEECEGQDATWKYDPVLIDDEDELAEEFPGGVFGRSCEQMGGESGKPIKDFENNIRACLCDPTAQIRASNEFVEILRPSAEFSLTVEDECIKAHTTAGLETGWKENANKILEYDPSSANKVPKKRWQSYCSTRSTCKSYDGYEIKELHTESLGGGNTFHLIKNVCEMGCFENGTGNVPIAGEDPITAYYHSVGSEGAVIGTIAKKTGGSYVPKDWEGEFKNGRNKYIQIIADAESCAAFEVAYKANVANNPQSFSTSYVPIGSDGKPADTTSNPPTQNAFSTVGGPYTAQCQAISFHAPFRSSCVKTKNAGNAASNIGPWYEESPEYTTMQECEAAQARGEAVEWNQINMMEQGSRIDDFFYGKIVLPPDNPQPGYIQPRHRLKKGACSSVSSGVVSSMPPTLDPTYKPELIRHASGLSPPQDCYASSPTQSSVDYTYSSPSVGMNESALENIWVPRTATIPIKIDGYGGNMNEVGGVLNEFYEEIGVTVHNRFPTQKSNLYMATVTELRHAAVSFESWKNYIKTMAPHLACWMYAQDPFFRSAWRDLCPVLSLQTRAGIGSGDIDALKTLGMLHEGIGIVDNYTPNLEIVGNSDKARKYAGTSVPESGPLNKYDESRMQLDRAYKAIRDVATNYYGRKYLVPLPIFPPKKEYCTGYTTKVNSQTGNIEKDERIDNRADCEEQGFIWGAHADLDKMLDTKGIENKTNWEIVEAGWPGPVSIDLTDRDQNGYTTIKPDSFPTNPNFFNSDGNIKAFALFPENIQNRINQEIQNVSFENYDPEEVQITENTRVLFDFFNSGIPELSAFAQRFGNKVYTEITVDPEIYWLDDISLHEKVMGHQYYMHEAGDGANVGIGSATSQYTRTVGGVSADFPEFASVGTKTEKADGNKQSGRSIFTSGDVNNVSLAGPTMTASEGFPKRPYALITLPDAVVYQENDYIDSGPSQAAIGIQQGITTFRSGFQIPLTDTINGRDLLAGWTGHHRLPFNYSDVVALTSLANWMEGQLYNPHQGIDVDRMSMVSAAVKPWHAGIPQESNEHRWGPWVIGDGMGEIQFEVNDSYHPAAFGGRIELQKSAFTHVKSDLDLFSQHDSRMAFETGSVTLASGPEHKLGQQPKFTFPSPYKSVTIDPLSDLGPYVTDISLSIGDNGITTRYGFNTQASFGSIDKIYEQRIRSSQKELIKRFKKQEDDLKRTKRNIQEYRE